MSGTGMVFFLAVSFFALFMTIYAPSFNSSLLGINLTTASDDIINMWRAVWIIVFFGGFVGIIGSLKSD